MQVQGLTLLIAILVLILLMSGILSCFSAEELA